MEGELFRKVGFIAEIHHRAIFHIAYRNPTFTNNFYF